MRILNRRALLKFYSGSRRDDAQSPALSRLEPSHCARQRDPQKFSERPFEELFREGDEVTFELAPSVVLRWVSAKTASDVLPIIGLEGVDTVGPSVQRMELMKEAIAPYAEHFEQELTFVRDFTSCIIWLKPTVENYVANASFYELPHCTLFSDAALRTTPPDSLYPGQMTALCLLENLFHEALHHQMHAIRSFSGHEYVKEEAPLDLPKVSLDWRERNFTLVEAFHALHVYAHITPLRLRWLILIREGRFLPPSNDHVRDVLIVEKAVHDGLRMWRDLAAHVRASTAILDPFWMARIVEWDDAFDATCASLGASGLRAYL